MLFMILFLIFSWEKLFVHGIILIELMWFCVVFSEFENWLEVVGFGRDTF